MKSWTVWEDNDYMAFLTPFPNTPGLTVVIPKNNVGDYLFSLESDDYQGLLDASKIVARKIEKAFNTPRVAMIVEGTGVAHVHVKLFAIDWRSCWSDRRLGAKKKNLIQSMWVTLLHMKVRKWMTKNCTEYKS